MQHYIPTKTTSHLRHTWDGHDEDAGEWRRKAKALRIRRERLMKQRLHMAQ